MTASSFSKKTAIGLAMLMVVGGIAVAAPPHTPLGPVTDAYVGTIQTLTFGKDHTFLQGELNYAWDDAGCDDAEAECSGNVQPNGEAYAAYRIDDRNGAGSAERGVGARYFLAKACDQQNITLPIQATMSWDQNLDARDRSPGTGNGAVATYLYARSAHEPATVNGPYVDSTNLSPASGLVTRTFSFTIDGANQTYDTTIGVQSTASVTDLPPPSHDYAHPFGSVSLKSVDISFGDGTAPVSTPTLSPQLGASGSTTGSFKGYYKTFPTLSVDTFDPIVSGQSTIPHSCVARVNLGDGLDPLAVDYFQNDVTKLLDQNRRYDLDVAAIDYNENTESSHKLSLVVDVQRPITSGLVWPLLPTGNNSWYKGPAKSVQFNVTCDDRHGRPTTSDDYSGCSRSNWSISPGASGFATPTDGTRYIVQIDTPSQGWNVSITASSMDRATNQGNSTTAGGIQVDFLPPGVGFNRTRVPLVVADWYNAPVTFTFDCDGRNEISGCAHVRTSVNGGPFTPITNHTFSTEGNNTVVGQVEDVAGNQANSTKLAKLDFTLPSPVGLPRLISANRTVDGMPYVKQTPWFKWNPASDNRSGVNHYIADVDGSSVTVYANNTAMAPTSLSQGMHTFHVSAVDRAGNVGPASEVPFFFDNLVPSVSFSSLVPGRIYYWDGTTDDTNAQGTSTSYAPVIVLRDIFVNVSSTDGSAITGSGMWSTKLYDAAGQLPIDCDVETTDSCSLEIKKQQGLNNGAGSSLWLGRGEDLAQNLGATLVQPMELVDIGVSNQFPGTSPPAGQSSSTGTVFWSPYAGADFQAYEIHRSTSIDFTAVEPNDPLGRPTTLVEAIDDQDQTKWIDEAPLVGGQQGVYYYQLVIKHGAGTLPLYAYSHKTMMNYATAHLSSALACQPGALQCLD